MQCQANTHMCKLNRLSKCVLMRIAAKIHVQILITDIEYFENKYVLTCQLMRD